MLQRLASLLRMQPPIIANRGLLFASGATVPTNGTDGYQTGCLFLHTDGGAGTALYVNEGSVTSCTFQALAGGIGAGSLAALSDIGTAPSYTAGKILVADGGDYEEVAVSGDATLAANGALTLAANSVVTGDITDLNVTTAKLASGAVTATKIEGLAAGQIIVGVDGTPGNNAKVAVSGDITMSAAGVTVIGAGKVSVDKIEGLAAAQFIVGTNGTAAGNAKVTLSGPFNLSSAGLLSMDSATVVAAGSAQGDATAVADGFSLVTSADGTKGVKLPAAAAGGFCAIKNNAASSLKIYPNTDDKIDDGAANANIVIGAEKAVVLVAYDATDWYTVGEAVDSIFDLYDVGTASYTGGKVLVADGSKFEPVAISGPFNLAATGLISMDSATVAALGSLQGDAAALADGFSLVTDANGTKGVRLPSAAAGGFCIIKNNANAILKVWPATDDAIDAVAANTAIAVDPYRVLYLVAYDGTTWYSQEANTYGLADLDDVGATAYTSGAILIANASSYAECSVSGDATLASGGALTIAAGAVTAAKLATETATHTIALTDLRKSAACKTALPDAGDATDLGLAAGAGSPVKGTTTNNNAVTEKCAFDFVVPQNVGDGDLVLRIKFLFSAARASESLLDVVCKHIKSGGLDATDLCLTDPIDVKAVVAETNEDFTIDHDAAGDEIAAGSVLHFEISAESDDGGGGTAGYAQINGIQVRIPCRV